MSCRDRLLYCLFFLTLNRQNADRPEIDREQKVFPLQGKIFRSGENTKITAAQFAYLSRDRGLPTDRYLGIGTPGEEVPQKDTDNEN